MGDSKEIAAPVGRPDGRPTATFILFAYNQEHFIREAVQGAFAQTYEPLEIVLSDDCSTDQTFEIMAEMASTYSGPHRVRVVRTPKNLGLLGHVLTRGREAVGDVVVVAAGDDISEPHRTSRIVDAFATNSRLGAVGSWVSDIDEDGSVLNPERRLNLVRDTIIPRDDIRLNLAVLGCSAAYRRWVFDVPVSSVDRHYGEDLLLSFYANLVGAEIESIASSLVRYRKHPGALSNLVDTQMVDVEDYIRRAAVGRIEFLDECEKIAIAVGKTDLLDMREIARARAFASDALAWPELKFGQRLSRTVRADYTGVIGPNLRQLLWRVVRLWGRYPRYQPKLLISRIRAGIQNNT